MTDARRIESKPQHPSNPHIARVHRPRRFGALFVACALFAGVTTGCDAADPALSGDPAGGGSSVDVDAGMATMGDPPMDVTADASVDPAADAGSAAMADAAVDPTADAGMENNPAGGASGLEAAFVGAGTSFFTGSTLLAGASSIASSGWRSGARPTTSSISRRPSKRSSDRPPSRSRPWIPRRSAVRRSSRPCSTTGEASPRRPARSACATATCCTAS